MEEIKYITKKELIHRAITNIRIRLKLYKNHKRKNVKYIISAKNQAWFLYDLDIISEKNCILLDKIIDNEYRRLSEKRKSCAKRQTGQSQNQLDYNTGGLEMK